jgi:hypothetical protein
MKRLGSLTRMPSLESVYTQAEYLADIGNPGSIIILDMQ